jgi:hypothetical protein
MRGVAGGAAIILAGRCVRYLLGDLGLDGAMTAATQGSWLGSEKGPEIAGVGLVTGRAGTTGYRCMAGSTLWSRDGHLMAIATELALGGNEQACCFRGMSDMACVAVATLERRMIGQAGGCGKGALVAGGTEVLALGHQQVGATVMGKVAGRALPGGHRCMQDRKAGLGAHTHMTVGAEFILHGHQESFAAIAMGIVAHLTIVGRRGMDDLRLG